MTWNFEDCGIIAGAAAGTPVLIIEGLGVVGFTSSGVAAGNLLASCLDTLSILI